MPRTRTAAIGATAAVIAAAVVAGGAAYGMLRIEDASAPRTSQVEQVRPAPTPSAPRHWRTPDPGQQAADEFVLAPGDRGRKVRELQSRLAQLHWYEPKITGTYDRVTRTAVRGFQDKRGFDPTGRVDRRTWRRVVAMTREPTDDEMHNRLVPGPMILGPDDTGAKVRELQARLKQIGWFSGDVTDTYGDVTREAVSGFQTKRAIPSTGKVDRRTMDRLLAMTHEPTKAELHNREPASSTDAPLDSRCKTGRVLCIDKSTNSLRWVVGGSVRSTVDVRFGAEETPTRDGRFSVTFKSRDHVSSLYHTPMPYAMFFSGGQAVHYSSDFAARGYEGASHGCVNVRDLDAIKAMYDQVQVGDTVVVYWS